MLLQLWGGAHINWWCNGCEQLQAEVTRSKIMIQILTNITGAPTLKSTHLPLEIKSPFCENQCWMSQSLMNPLVSNMSWPDSQQTDRNQVPSQTNYNYNSQKKGWLPGWKQWRNNLCPQCLMQDAYYLKKRDITLSYIWNSQQPLVAPHHRSSRKNRTIISPSVICLLICFTFHNL